MSGSTDPKNEQLALEAMNFILPGFLIGGYVTSWLAGMVFGEAVRVLYCFPKDPPLLRLLVSVVSCLSLANNCWFEAIVERYSTTAFHDMILLDIVNPELGFHILLSRALITTSQLFFCYRLWIFSNKNRPVLGIALLLCMYHVATSTLVGVRFIQAKNYSQLSLITILYLWSLEADHFRNNLDAALLSLYTSALASDLLITGALVMIKRIILLSFETSLVTTALIIASVVVLGHVGLGVLYALTLVSAQLYILSILVTLSSRADFAKAWASEANKSLTFSQQHCHDFKRLPYEGVGVQVDQIIMTDVDADAPPVALPKFAKVRPSVPAHQATPTENILLYNYFPKELNSDALPSAVSDHRAEFL